MSKLLARTHCASLRWIVRALTSYPTVYPATCASAFAASIRRPPLPITTASSASESTCDSSRGSTIGSPGPMSADANFANRIGASGA